MKEKRVDIVGGKALSLRSKQQQEAITLYITQGTAKKEPHEMISLPPPRICIDVGLVGCFAYLCSHAI